MQRYFVTITLLHFFLVLTVLSGKAQTENAYFFKEFTKIQQAYKGKEPLSFTVRYLYSTVSQPAIYQDSVIGRFTLSKGNSWGILGEAEYLTSEEYKIIVYPRTAATMLDKREEDETLAFFQLDSFFAQKEAFTLLAPAPGRVQMQFRDHPLAYSAELVYDPQTYRLEKMSYRLKPSVTSTEEQNGEEGLVQILFSDYSTAPVDERLFAAEKYIQKKGKEYLPSPAYAGYSVYLASSKLIN